MHNNNVDYSLYLVTDRDCLGGKDLVATVEQALQGGATVVQVREKNLSTLEFFQVTSRIKSITDKYGIPLIVNDRADIALAVDAAGLHIGQEDLPLAVARRLLGPDKIIGVSASTLEEALLAQEQGADYLGVGAVFPTNTKDDADSVSLAALKSIKEQVRIPVVAIGGINRSNVQPVMETGIAGVAVVSAIIAAQDPYEAASDILQLIRA
ncbi:thiamine phosphate synthase [Sporomusa sphaeroides]|uniref:Thiamine-phosphate synthase n=1 Tax=Sporomusa sphaeroides DSM 2875 TaxID=1337886 RepID=A0ABP2C4E3_9FIRM|nr:thiamine phosphate synthase [Sporomusa sphaeroides]OLS56290.1 thiamine-phosphate synthase [Sporomusa sphaeroides DSM 2875]CVK18386.1 Thiamine-phosphate synthase [Sporomusa sphaeroides DSM 2875]